MMMNLSPATWNGSVLRLEPLVMHKIHRQKCSQKAWHSFQGEAVLHTLYQLQLYQTQVRLCIDYCYHLCDGYFKYQLAALDSLENRTCHLFGDTKLVKAKLQNVERRCAVACLSVFYTYRINHG